MEIIIWIQEYIYANPLLYFELAFEIQGKF